MESITNEVRFNSLSLTTHYIPRPRVYDLFNQVPDCKLFYVIAGAGYGKTQAVHHYLKQQDAVAWWMQLTDSDNISSRFWESFTHTVSINNPALSVKMRELGFPETLTRFKQFAEMIKSTKHCSHTIYFVFDDFHLIHAHEILIFAERCAHLQNHVVCIVISRKEPTINVVDLLSKNKVNIITEEELRFTTEEVEIFFLQQVIPFTPRTLLQALEVTKGWPIAINMLSMIFKKFPNNLSYALDAMTQNISKLLEIEAWNDFPNHVQKMLVKLSLLSNLPTGFMQELADEIVIEAASSQLISGLASFIRFSSFTNDIKIHPLYLEFLLNKHHILSEEEKQEVYQRAAKWCAENDFFMDAIRYYAKLDQFELMIKTLLSYPIKLPRDTSEYLLNIITGLKHDSKEPSPPSLLFLKNFFTPLLLAGLERYEEAENYSLAVIKEWAHVKDPLAYVFLYTSYSNLSYIEMYTCTSTHKYNAPEYLKKSVEYFNRTSIPPAAVAEAFVNADIRSFACLIGEGAQARELDEFLVCAKQVALCIEQTPYNVYAGYDDLVATEYAFFMNKPDLARNHANNAVLKAQSKKQYAIAAMAQNYLLRTAVQEGSISLVREALKHLHSYLDNPEFSNRQLYYDLYTGAFYATIGFPEMVPKWLVMDEKEVAFGIRLPTRELIVSALYYLSAQKYQQALTILCNSYPRDPYERFLFGEIKLLLFTAIARIKTDDIQGALLDFEKAYYMSFNGMLEMLFVERGKDMHPLIIAALNKEDCSIPQEWLKAIDRKASIYVKKVTVIKNALKSEHNIQELISLSSREKDVLKDIYHGLSREEIATNQYLSINTVKKILQSIYIKLDAGNNVDAIRIALDRNLL